MIFVLLNRLMLMQIIVAVGNFQPARDSINEMESVHSNGIEEVHDVPMAVITRPIPPVLDEDKVKSLMNTISVRAIIKSLCVLV